MLLTRNRNYFQIFLASLSPMIIVFWVLAELELDQVWSLSVLIICYLISFIFWFKNGTKPAAWISGGKLYIRNGAFCTDVVEKNFVESMHYETGYTRILAGRNREKIDMHVLVVKMRGFDEWTIPIKDLIEHGPNLRLYKFIKDSFYNLRLVKRSH